MVLHMQNHPEILVSYLAAFWIGAIVVPVSPRYKAEEFRALMQRVSPSLYLGQADFADALARTPDEILPARSRFTVGEPDKANGLRLRTELLEDMRGLDPAEAAQDPDAPALLLSTSGTTGTSKLVTWTGRTMAAVGRASLARVFSDDDIVLNASPMVHASGIDNWARCLFNGLPMVLLRSFEPEAVLDAIERHRCTFFAHLPFTFVQMTDHQRRRPRDLSSLRSCIAWGDVCPPETAASFQQVTGVSLPSMWSSSEDAGSGAPGSEPGPFTRFVPGVEMRLVDEVGRTVGDGETGEMWIRSSATTPGYWSGPGLVDGLPDGWFHTGDLLLRDTSGRFRYMGRKKQLIVRAGSNISPVEVENVLRDDPAVIDAMVFGSRDPELGQRVLAVVVLKTDASTDVEQVLRRVRERLADDKVPERLIVMDAIPRNSSGKVDRDAAVRAAQNAQSEL